MVDGRERVEVGVWFKDFGDGFGMFVTHMAFPVIGCEYGSHNVGLVGEIVRRFTDSGGGVDFKGEGEFHPGDAGVAGRYAFSPFASVVYDFCAGWLPFQFVAPLAEGVPDVVGWLVATFVWSKVRDDVSEPSGVEVFGVVYGKSDADGYVAFGVLPGVVGANLLERFKGVAVRLVYGGFAVALFVV